MSYSHETELTDCITCSDSLKTILTPTTISACNEIVKGLTEDDPGLVAHVLSYGGLHRVLGVPGAPAGLVQGADTEESYKNFRDWLIQGAYRVRGVTPANQVDNKDVLCWHHLSDEQVDKIAHEQWASDSWWKIAAQRARPAVLSPFCIAIKMVGSGPGRAHMYKMSKVFE